MWVGELEYQHLSIPGLGEAIQGSDPRNESLAPGAKQSPEGLGLGEGKTAT